MNIYVTAYSQTYRIYIKCSTTQLKLLLQTKSTWASPPRNTSHNDILSSSKLLNDPHIPHASSSQHTLNAKQIVKTYGNLSPHHMYIWAGAQFEFGRYWYALIRSEYYMTIDQYIQLECLLFTHTAAKWHHACSSISYSKPYR